MKENDLEISEEDLKEEDFSSEQLENDDFDWKAEAQKLKGIAKRRATQLSKAKEKLANPPKSETPPQDKISPDNALLKKTEQALERLEEAALKFAGITHKEDKEFFTQWKDSTGRDADAILENEIFKKELENKRTDRANAEATSGVSGGGGGSDAKNTSDYWKKQGRPPTKEDISDLKARVKIHNELLGLDKEEGAKGFYNE